MAVSQDADLKSIYKELLQARGEAKSLIAQFESLRSDLTKLQAVARAAAELCDNAEEYECDGLGLFAQHGWWEPLHDALEALSEPEPAPAKPEKGKLLR